MMLNAWRRIGSVILFVVCLIFRIDVRIREALVLYTWVRDAMKTSVKDDAPVSARIDGEEMQVWVCSDGATHNPITRSRYWMKRAEAAELELHQLRKQLDRETPR